LSGATSWATSAFDRFVRGGTLFYNASAVSISLTGSSIGAQFAPGNAALGGGVEFDTPADVLNQTVARAGSTFPLFSDKGHAISAPRGPQVFYRVLFTDPVGELEVGAPVHAARLSGRLGDQPQPGNRSGDRIAVDPRHDRAGA
jgi:paraquat-inducible protein B